MFGQPPGSTGEHDAEGPSGLDALNFFELHCRRPFGGNFQFHYFGEADHPFVTALAPGNTASLGSRSRNRHETVTVNPYRSDR